MKKRLLLALLVAGCAFAVVSCVNDDDDAVVDEVWKENNRLAILNLSDDFKPLLMEGYNQPIYYKALKQGDGQQPYYNSKVTVYYTGSLIDSAVFDAAEHPYQSPVTFAVDSVIAGWTIALQHMKVGDRWETYIPYQLGYGTTGTTSIPPYSTLHFEIEVVKVIP